MKITILHNPRCSTSRAVLDMIRQAGHEPDIVEYLRQPLLRQDLVALLVALEISPADLLRKKEPLAKELALTGPDASDETILAAMLEHPVLIERPVVIAGTWALLCRPRERVLEILQKTPS